MLRAKFMAISAYVKKSEKDPEKQPRKDPEKQQTKSCDSKKKQLKL